MMTVQIDSLNSGTGMWTTRFTLLRRRNTHKNNKAWRRRIDKTEKPLLVKEWTDEKEIHILRKENHDMEIKSGRHLL